MADNYVGDAKLFSKTQRPDLKIGAFMKIGA